MILNRNAQLFVIVFLNVVLANMESEETKVKARVPFVSLLKNIIDINQKRLAGINKINSMQDFIVTKNALSKIHGLDTIADSEDDDDRQNALLTFFDMESHLNKTVRRKHTTGIKAVNNLKLSIPIKRLNIEPQHITEENNLLQNFNNNNSKHIILIIMGNRNNNSDKTDYTNYGNDGTEYRDVNNEQYRKNWRGGCDKKASKACRKACVSAYKNVCMTYKCSRSAKRRFRRECKRNCRNKFISSKYSDSDWETE